MLLDDLSVTATLQRLTLANGIKTWVSMGQILVALQPLSSEDKALYPGNYSRAYKGYLRPQIDIEDADRLVIGGEIYEVHSHQKLSLNDVQYTEAFLERPAG